MSDPNKKTADFIRAYQDREEKKPTTVKCELCGTDYKGEKCPFCQGKPRSFKCLSCNDRGSRVDEAEIHARAGHKVQWTEVKKTNG